MDFPPIGLRCLERTKRPAALPGCRRLRAAGWGTAPPGWRQWTGGGGPSGARGPRRVRRHATCCSRSRCAGLRWIGGTGVCRWRVPQAHSVHDLSPPWRGSQWAGAGRGTGACLLPPPCPSGAAPRLQPVGLGLEACCPLLSP